MNAESKTAGSRGSNLARLRRRPVLVAWVAWSSWALSVAFSAGTWLLNSLNSPWLATNEETPVLLNTLLWTLSLIYVTVGALVASRRPENPIGWIFCGTGLIAISFQGFALAYAAYALGAGYGSLPGGEYMAWLSEWIAIPTIVPATVLLLLLFPSGRLPSRRWRIVVWMAVSGSVMLGLEDALAQGTLDAFAFVENPVGIGGVAGDVVDTLGRIGVYLTIASVFLAAVYLVVRLVRARGQEHQQLKWFAFAAAMMIGGFSVAFWFSFSYRINEIGWFIGGLGFFFFPVAVGIAILRYRLYDIDIVINRTLVYALLTLSLAATYLGAVVVLQGIFRAASGQESSLAVLASTLAIAALFNPLRRRIQDFIDRRFYRRKYDAAKTLEAFSARLRDETELEQLNADLLSVVRETMQPEHVSLWLREPGRNRGPGE